MRGFNRIYSGRKLKLMAKDEQGKMHSFSCDRKKKNTNQKEMRERERKKDIPVASHRINEERERCLL